MKKPTSRTEAANACVEILDADFFRALCEPARTQIFRQLILKGRSDIGTIAEAMPQDRSVIARHLQTLHSAGLLRVQREGRHRYYEVDGSSIVRQLERLKHLMRGLASLCCPPP